MANRRTFTAAFKARVASEAPAASETGEPVEAQGQRGAGGTVTATRTACDARESEAGSTLARSRNMQAEEPRSAFHLGRAEPTGPLGSIRSEKHQCSSQQLDPNADTTPDPYSRADRIRLLYVPDIRWHFAVESVARRVQGAIDKLFEVVRGDFGRPVVPYDLAVLEHSHPPGSFNSPATCEDSCSPECRLGSNHVRVSLALDGILFLLLFHGQRDFPSAITWGRFPELSYTAHSSTRFL